MTHFVILAHKSSTILVSIHGFTTQMRFLLQLLLLVQHNHLCCSASLLINWTSCTSVPFGAYAAAAAAVAVAAAAVLQRLCLLARSDAFLSTAARSASTLSQIRTCAHAARISSSQSSSMTTSTTRAANSVSTSVALVAY